MADAGRNPNAGRATGADDNAYAAMLARAEALIPVLRERAARAEELRRLTPAPGIGIKTDHPPVAVSEVAADRASHDAEANDSNGLAHENLLRTKTHDALVYMRPRLE